MTQFNSLLLKSDEVLDNSSNQSWWEQNPMTYDWQKEHGEVILTKDYFAKIDQIFGEGHSLLNNPRWPQGDILENFIPYADFKGKRVLEIGCGAGLVASHIARSGADFTAIDLTNQAIKITTRRMELFGLKAEVKQMDAEKLEFADNTFDYVVSWGVIHHSGNMQAVLDHIHRVLKPGGKAYLMVYNLHSLRYQVFCRFWLGLVRLRFLKQNLAQIAGSITDGYIARHLTKNEFRQMAQKFSQSSFTCSDEIDTTASYAFGSLKHIFKPFPKLKRKSEEFLAKRWGWYLEATLTK